jgi:hypothetical protein
MPLNRKGRTILTAMKEKYGPKKGEEVFYKSLNAGRIKGVEMRRRRRRKRKNRYK